MRGRKILNKRKIRGVERYLVWWKGFIADCNLNNGEQLSEVTVKIGLERVDTQEGVTVEVLLNSRVIGLVMSSEFARKQRFKLKKIERPIYVRNVDGSFNKEKPIKHTVEENI